MPVVDALGPQVRSRWVFNCYLIPDAGEGRPLLIDVGLRSHAAAAAQWLAQHHLSRPLVAATHLHSDHVGGIPTLCNECGMTDESVLLPARAQPYLDGSETPRSPGLREVARIHPVFRSQRFSLGSLIEQARGPQIGYGLREMSTPASSPTWLHDGETMFSAGEWQVLSAPGHTDDSTAFYHEASRTLASGDAVLTANGRAWFNPEYVDAARSAETEDRFRSLRVDVLLPGHGRPLVGRDLLAQARSSKHR